MAAEKDQQLVDIIAAFPPVVLVGEEEKDGN
jgi:hypothetical protein